MSKGTAIDLGLTGAYNDLFSTQEERDNAGRTFVTDLDPAKISDFPNHPFHVRMDEESPTAYTLNTGNPLTPNLAPGYMLGDGVIINGNTGVTVAPPDFNTISSGIVSGSGTNTGGTATPTPSTGFTEVTSDLYYKGGYLATLKIPSLNVNVKVYEGTSSSVLAKGAGHFEDTSIWDGNCAIAGHNRGANCYFGPCGRGRKDVGNGGGGAGEQAAGPVPKEPVCRAQPPDGTVGVGVFAALSLRKHPCGDKEGL